MGDQSHEMPIHGAVIPCQLIKCQTGVTPVGRPSQIDQAESRIDLVREGEIVKFINITCACGEKIQLRCDYGQVNVQDA